MNCASRMKFYFVECISLSEVNCASAHWCLRGKPLRQQRHKCLATRGTGQGNRWDPWPSCHQELQGAAPCNTTCVFILYFFSSFVIFFPRVTREIPPAAKRSSCTSPVFGMSIGGFTRFSIKITSGFAPFTVKRIGDSSFT